MSETSARVDASQNLLFKAGWVILLLSAGLMTLNHFGLMFVFDNPILFMGWGAFNLYSLFVVAIPLRRQEKWAWYATWILPVGLAAGGSTNPSIAILYYAVAAVCVLGLLLTMRGSLAIALLLLSLVLGGLPFGRPSVAHAAPPGAMQEVTIKGNEYAFDAPEQINAGWTRVTFQNTGKEEHQVNFARIKDGKTMADLQAAMQQNLDSALGLLDFYGGVSGIPGGTSGTVVLDLKEGQYVMICFLPAPDGTTHVEHGMIRPLAVVAPAAEAAAPQADDTVTLKDFSIALPGTIKAGEQTWQVVNSGPQIHEMALIKLAEGKTMQDVGAWMNAPSGPPPFAYAGGMAGLSQGIHGYMTVNLAPGNYVALCGVPDPASGKPHFMLGMVAPFTITGGAAAPTTLPTTGGSGATAALWLLLLGAGLAAAALLRRGASRAWRMTRTSETTGATIMVAPASLAAGWNSDRVTKATVAPS
ncbi:MAG: hypothetical protein M5U01_16540 [Ardenticatenaceae bacterium]|nr:hypothetical protein [Ardenticatenaceae bacterium]